MHKKALGIISLILIILDLLAPPAKAVLNGEPQPDNKWVVAITSKDKNRAQLCSGVLIETTTVVTAKHCAINEQGKKFQSIQINAPGAKYSFPFNTSMELRNVTKVIAAKVIKNKWNNDEGDIAFLRIDKPFSNFELVKIGTPEQIATLKPWSLIKGYGYGTTGDGTSKYSEIPRRYDLSWGNDDHAVMGTLVFIASVSSMACAGDSGGPVTGILDDGQEVLLGAAVSIGNKDSSGCEQVNLTRMYYLNFNLINPYLKLIK